MVEFNNMYDTIIDSLKKLFYPEEWIELDMSLSKSEIFALLIVYRHGEIIMSQIADYVNVPMSTATGIVERLVKNGYLKRERSEEDRRVVVIKLTEKGSKLAEDLKAAIMRYVQLVYDSLTEEERQLLMNVFIKVAGVLNKHHPQAETPAAENSRIKKISIE